MPSKATISVGEAFYVVRGRLEAQLDDQRVQAAALPGGVEELFAEQAACPARCADRRAPDPGSGRSGFSELDVVVERSSVRNRGGTEDRPLVELVGG